jgi:RNA polymerase sigma-70 factor (ECF subfamily)
MNDTQHIRDELLVLRARSAPEEFNALVDRWHAALWRHAYRLTHDRELAWDAVQEAWCAIYRRLDRLDDPAAFPKWAFRIVTNKCRDFARSNHRHQAALANYEAQPKLPVSPATRDERLALALERLDPALRVLVALYYEESFSIREISEITGDPEGSVKSRLYRARHELRRMMEELGHE